MLQIELNGTVTVTLKNAPCLFTVSKQALKYTDISHVTGVWLLSGEFVVQRQLVKNNFRSKVFAAFTCGINYEQETALFLISELQRPLTHLTNRVKDPCTQRQSKHL